MGAARAGGGPTSRGQQVTSVKKRTPGSAPCRRSATLGEARGKVGRLWGAHPDPSRLQAPPGCPPSAGCPPRLTELAAGVGLGSLAAVTELHERVQGARGHGQVDGVAEGGAGRRRGKQRNHPSQGMAGALRHPPALPRRAPGRRAVLGELSGRKGAPGGGRTGSRSLAQHRCLSPFPSREPQSTRGKQL